MQGAAETGVEEQHVPRVVPGWEARGAELSPEEGFLLSRIDGSTAWGVLRQIAGISPERADRFLERCLAAGLVVVDGRGSNGHGGDPSELTPPGREAGSTALDPSLDIPVELQRRILDFEARLESPYHEILGVPRDADARTLKRAYFKLSKDFHPDRYFRKEIGGFAARLDRIFKRVALAYELLVDPATRAELERSMDAAPPELELQQGPGGQRHKLGRRELLARLRRQFRIPEEVLTERRLQARHFLDAARVSQHQRRWKEAASSMRLAIAFDPWTDDYKRVFEEIQTQVVQLRAAELLDEASKAWADPRSQREALRLCEEALHYRPSDPGIHDRAAQVALELGDLERACEYAERACELGPEAGVHHLTLARVLRRQGLREKARVALERARKLDPDDRRVEEELRRLRQRPGRSSGGKR